MKPWFALLCCVPLFAHAGTVLPQSQLSFTYKQMGVEVEGHFDQFQTTLNFDPAKPAAGDVRVEVDLASANAGSPDATDSIKQGAWFDSSHFPKAIFAGKGFSAAGANKFQAKGTLSLKGKTLPVVIVFSSTPAANGSLNINGQTSLKRTAFAVGTGEWADTGTVEDDVVVKFHLQYKP